MAMTNPPYDPVHKTQYSFERDGENLIVDSLMDPGGHLPEHFHPIQEEHWSVVEGRVEVQLDGVWREIGPDDGAVVVKPGHKHAVRAVLDRRVHLRCHVYPALSLEEFLTDASIAAQDGLISKGGLPKGLKGAR